MYPVTRAVTTREFYAMHTHTYTYQFKDPFNNRSGVILYFIRVLLYANLLNSFYFFVIPSQIYIKNTVRQTVVFIGLLHFLFLNLLLTFYLPLAHYYPIPIPPKYWIAQENLLVMECDIILIIDMVTADSLSIFPVTKLIIIFIKLKKYWIISESSVLLVRLNKSFVYEKSEIDHHIIITLWHYLVLLFISLIWSYWLIYAL